MLLDDKEDLCLSKGLLNASLRIPITTDLPLSSNLKIYLFISRTRQYYKNIHLNLLNEYKW